MEGLPDLTVELHGEYTLKQLIEIIRERITTYNSQKSAGGMGDRVIVSVQRGPQEN